MPGLRLKLRPLIDHWAPPWSRLRRILWRIKFLVVNAKHLRRALRRIRWGRLLNRTDTVRDPEQLRQHLRMAGVRGFRWSDCDPAKDRLSAARWILRQLLTDPEAEWSSRTPLRDGIDGDFGKSLVRRLSTRSDGLNHVKAVFAKPPGQRIRLMYDEYSNWRDEFPLALTPSGRGRFLQYLLAGALPFWKLSIEEVFWFHLENAEDPMAGVDSTYLLNPEWQQIHPMALTPEGWPSFKSWLKRKYRIRGSWLDSIPSPPTPDNTQRDLLRRLCSPQQSPTRHPKPFGINVMGHFRYPSGLGEAALNTVAALEFAEVPHAKRDVPNNHTVDLFDRSGYLDLEPYDVSLSTVAALPLGENRYRHAGLWKRDGVHRIACWYWELETVPSGWVEEARHFQEIWAPSRFIRDAFASRISIPIIHMPAGIRFPKPTRLSRAELGLPTEPFLFLFMFDMASLFQRKNPLAVIESFCRAVGRSRDVRLVIKVSRGECDPANLKLLREACDDVDAILINRVMTRAESLGLLENCDCYISLHRSEGYGLTIAEAMSFGKPVIATGYSGNLDFTSPETARLVPYQLVALDRDFGPYMKGAFWADPSIEAASRDIRWMLDRPLERLALAERGQNEVRRLLSLKAFGQRMRERLQVILALD